MIKGYLVQHTHWDREWYFTVEDAKVLSDQVFTEAIDELVKNKNVNFVLDGQSSIVDEYLEINPDKYDTIKELVKEKRLFIGPWFTQTDGLLVDAESILRNLIIGISDTKAKYGQPMMHGYLPDTFGFNAQLPSLLNHVGIDTFFAWRGINFEKISPSPYFKWNGLGNSSVYAMYFPYGYMTALMTLDAINNVDEFVKKKLDPNIKFLSEHGNNSDVLLPSGIDQKSMVLDFDKIVDDINEFSEYKVKISSYDEFADIIKSKKSLPEYKGELRLPVYSRVHRTIGSVRTRMKIDNFKLEQLLIRKIEPLMLIAKKLDIHISKGLLKRAWKKVLENQAHDSIGGCVSDNVAQDIFHRIKEANEIVEGISNLILKRIADNLELKQNEVLIVNTDPYDFSGEKDINIVTRTKNIKFDEDSNARIIDEILYPERHNVQKLISTGFEYITEKEYYDLTIRLHVDIPAMGYKIIKFEEGDIALPQANEISGNKISFNQYSIVFENQSINLYNEDNLIIENFISLTDLGNDGDTYDFSPLKDEKEIELPIINSYIMKNQIETLVLEGKYELPYSLEDRINSTNNKKEVSYKILLSYDKNIGVLKGKVVYQNNVLSHRLRLKINSNEKSNEAIAQIQNGFITNINHEVEENWNDNYVEKPTNLNIFDKSITKKSKDFYITAFVDGIKEYEVQNENLFVTLFATTGQLGKPDLAWRPGRASGDTTNEGHVMIPTPLAEELGEHEVTFDLLLSSEFDEYRVAKLSVDRLSPSISYQRQNLNKFINRLDNKIWPYQNNFKRLQREFSLINIPENIIVSSIYPSYFSDNKMIIRIANPTSEMIEIEDLGIQEFEVVNGVEEVKEYNGLKISPYDYITIRKSL